MKIIVWSNVVDTTADFYRNNKDIRKIGIFSLDTVSCISLISNDQKENSICTMDNVRGDFIGPPHGTTPAAVIGNKNKTDPLRAVNILMRREIGHTMVSAT